MDLPSRTLRYLTGRLAAREIGTRWRHLTAGRQALLALAHLRCGDTYTQLAAGSGIGIATAYRHIREAVHVLAALTPTLAEAMRITRTKALVTLDGTPLPINRIAANTPYHSGKHKRHGMNIHVLTDPIDRPLRASPTLPGSTHDLTTARTQDIAQPLTDASLKCRADKAYQGADDPIRAPFRARRLKQRQRHHNSTHAKIRYLGERPWPPSSWRLLRKLRYSTNCITAIVQAIPVLHHASA
ncbi:transposase family protein [Streptomyces cyaneofuscatus]|uniref:transposase family protein n=1 Tax=Streptomyces cyaneofuscatus TaxID=66883 RepID=UPI0037B46D2D